MHRLVWGTVVLLGVLNCRMQGGVHDFRSRSCGKTNRDGDGDENGQGYAKG